MTLRATARACSRVSQALSFLVVLGTSSAFAQLTTATVLGTVKDTSGAAVPGATVVARNVDTAQSRTTVVGQEGSYRLPALPVGNYEVRVELSGFKTAVRSGLVLTVSQEAVINFTLEVGSVEEAITVTAAAPLVNTTSGSLGGLVDEQRMADLPLNGRNYIDLALLQPGVNLLSTKTGGNPGTLFSSNGAPIKSNSYLLDGASMITLFGASPSSFTGTTLGVEGIQEFRVITNSFSAEYGMSMGSQTLLVSKSGANAFHGSMFEYFRNDALDARNFFDRITPATPGRLPEYKRNNFGGSFGGPIRTDKTFFFVVYEGLRERLGRTILSNVIAASAKVDGGLVPQISPAIKPFLAYFPDPNLPNNQYTFTVTQPTDEDYGQVRVDQHFSAKDTMFVRYTIDSANLTTPGAYPISSFSTVTQSVNQYVTASENHVFSSALLNTFRVSFSRTNLVRPLPPGLNGPQFAFVGGQDTGNISIGGVTPWGGSSNSPSDYRQNILAWSDDLFYSRGRHALKAGALINFYDLYILNSSNVRGTINFANVQSFLLGQPSAFNVITPGSAVDRSYRLSTQGFYLQDDLRVKSNLTVNLGLRYEFLTTIEEANNRAASFRDVAHDAGPTTGPLFKNPSLGNVGPRLGFAWDVTGTGSLAVRGGFARLFDLFNYGGALLQTVCSPPACNSSAVSNPPGFTLPLAVPAGTAANAVKGFSYDLKQPQMLQYNLTIERQLPWQMAASIAYAGSQGSNLMQTTEGNPTTPQILADGTKFWTGTELRLNPNWGTYELHTATGSSSYNSLQFQLFKRLSHGLQLQSSYTWSKAIDQGSNQQGSEANAGSAALMDPADINRDRGPASFDITHQWRFNAIYQLPQLRRQDILGQVLNGWRVSGIVALRTGLPLTPGEQTNRSRSGVTGGGVLPGVAVPDRPDLVPGIAFSDITSGVSRGCGTIAAGTPVGTPSLWFDPCAFSLQPIGLLGTAGRHILRGPGLATVDLSLAKRAALKAIGGKPLELRVEIFNLLNRANFDLPNLTVFSGTSAAPLATAGVITSTSTTSRQIQLALRFEF
jgi:hypothetical protein